MKIKPIESRSENDMGREQSNGVRFLRVNPERSCRHHLNARKLHRRFAPGVEVTLLGHVGI